MLTAVGGAGGVATGGDINIRGQRASNGMMTTNFITFSNGGSSHLGLGGAAVFNTTADAGSGFGSGGGGINTYGFPGAQAAKAGAAGSAGLIRVWVYG
jgi:hypothetical protein